MISHASENLCSSYYEPIQFIVSISENLKTGRTCLPLLADAAETSNDEVSWDGETTTSREAWLRLAGTLLELGCDPHLTETLLG